MCARVKHERCVQSLRKVSDFMHFSIIAVALLCTSDESTQAQWDLLAILLSQTAEIQCFPRFLQPTWCALIVYNFVLSVRGVEQAEVQEESNTIQQLSATQISVSCCILFLESDWHLY